MPTRKPQLSSKIFLIGAGTLVLLAILVFAGNKFASADALMKGQKATQSLSEGAQLEIDSSNVYLDRDVDMALGAWSDPIPGRTDQAAIMYFSGVHRKSKYGVVIRFTEIPRNTEEFTIGEETGMIKIMGKQGDFLVLQSENSAALYFNVIMSEFTHSMEGTVTPIPTFTVTPVPPYPAP